MNILIKVVEAFMLMLICVMALLLVFGTISVSLYALYIGAGFNTTATVVICLMAVTALIYAKMP